jgi:hypothetical protein
MKFKIRICTLYSPDIGIWKCPWLFSVRLLFILVFVYEKTQLKLTKFGIT